ncbi:hypothetical protein AAEX37_02056 [Oligella sp. MSHR50489EDL]|uniref:hypothetical protein n=1 Tax=Oligella sp. MSHR50489EDL TaxID=3139409 RepID=UPI003D817BE4
MNKLLLPAIALTSCAILSACGSFGTQTVGDEKYVRTMDQGTDKVPEALGICLNDKLKAYQPSAHVRPRTTEIWSGAVPSQDSNQPQAIIEIATPTHGAGALHAHLKVFQREPVVEEINDVIKQCL